MLLFLVSILNAQPTTWEFTGQQGMVFLYQDKTFVSLFWAQDNQQSNGFGQLHDIDQRIGHIAIKLPTLSLRAGEYQLTSTEKTESFIVPPPSSTSTTLLPEKTKGLIAFGQSSFAYAPNEGGLAFINPPSQATFIPFQGRDSFYTAPSLSQNTFSIQDSYQKRTMAIPFNWVAYVLFPISVLLLGILYKTVSRYRKRTWIFPILIGSALISSALPIDSNTLLVSEIGFDDPPTSASFLSSIAQNPLSSVSTSFSFPEGHNWLIMGSSWLAYLLMLPFVWLLDGVQAHNIGIGLFCAALCWSIFHYAKSLSLKTESAFFAAMGGVLCPVFINELDKLSLDRAFLFPIPIILLLLSNKHASILSTAGMIALLFYGQFYYGIFLGAALPFLLLYRMRAKNFYAAALALILMIPGLLLLKESTGGTIYDSEPFVFADLWNPITAQELDQYTQQFDPRLGAGQGNRPMITAKEQLMASIVNSVQIKDILLPSVYFCGQSLYWFWVALALFISRKKSIVFKTALDVAILSLFALGPFIRNSAQELLAPLPMYAYQLLIPSFTQLKHPDRFAPMAAIIAAIPIAFALQALLKYIRTKWARWCITIVALVITTRVGIIKEDAQSWGDISVTFLDTTHRIGLKKFQLPQASVIAPTLQYTFPPNSSVSLFPQTHPIKREHYIPFLAQHIPMQNPAPHGEFSDTQLQLWAEQNRILNGMAYLSASNKVKTYFGLSAGEHDLRELTEQGLTHIAIYLPDLIHPSQQSLIQQFLSPFGTIVHTDTQFEIYALREAQ